jgi:FKBP-type peptidyl-prolyl cis-trans isomerase 2
LDNGRIFHSSDEHGPLVVTIGDDQLFPALEQALIGMRAGEVKNVVLSADQGYGPRLEENILILGRGVFPADKEISVGQKLSIEFKGGQSRNMLVIAVDETQVTLDGNHPLAGCLLTFAVRVNLVE